jgi:hypothetical protein
MASLYLAQELPRVSESPIPKEKQNLKGFLAALVLICLVSLPISYFIGNFNGYNSGYRSGVNAGESSGYLEGFSEGLDSGKYYFYYVKPEQKYGVYELDDWLTKWKWLKPYQEGVFDCSEMSAYLERKLENEGWHTKIVVGNSPFSSGRHAWLLVETSDGAYMPVESTNMHVVWWSSSYFDNYFKYDHAFETIQNALEYSETEFDWWKS